MWRIAIALLAVLLKLRGSLAEVEEFFIYGPNQLQTTATSAYLDERKRNPENFSLDNVSYTVISPSIAFLFPHVLSLELAHYGACSPACDQTRSRKG